MGELPWNVARGFLMGAADIVPGVSGGTIALVVGIYERLIESVRSGSSALGALVRLDGQDAVAWLRRVEWKLVVPLLLGILVAIATLARFLETQLADNPVQIAGLFLGLVAGAAVVAWRLMRRRYPAMLAILAVVAGATFVLLGLREGTSEETVAQISDPALLAFFGAGAIAICAMILPGISGSFLLVVMGMYGPVLAAVNDRSMGTLLVFILGAALGLALFSQLLHWALRRHHDVVMAALIGLMIGATRVLWPWPHGVDTTSLGRPDGAVAGTVLLAVVGLVTVVLIDVASRRFAPRPDTVIS